MYIYIYIYIIYDKGEIKRMMPKYHCGIGQERPHNQNHLLTDTDQEPPPDKDDHRSLISVSKVYLNSRKVTYRKYLRLFCSRLELLKALQ